MKFFIGIGQYKLDLSDCMSLKDKRQLMKSLIDRLGNSKVLGVSEVAGNDKWKTGEIALTCVSSSDGLVREMLVKSKRTIESTGVEILSADEWVFNSSDIEDDF